MVSTRYSTVNIVRTIEDVLGDRPSQYQRCLSTADDRGFRSQSVLVDLHRHYPCAHCIGARRSPQQSAEFHDAHPAAYWAHLTRGFDWTTEDRIPPVLFNRILWNGLTGGRPYPVAREGQDYSVDRADVLKARTIHFEYEGQ